MTHPRKAKAKGNDATPHRPKLTHATLDGQPAAVTFPLKGKAIVCTTDGKRRAQFDQDKAREIMCTGGAFESPAFARPKDQR